MKSTDKVETAVDPVAPAAAAPAAEAESAITADAAVTLTNAERDNEVLNTIKNHTIAAMGIGILPVPGLDLVALTGVQLNLLRKLGALYDKKFSDELAKKLLGSLLGGYLPLALVAPVASVLKFVPGVGVAAGVLAQSATAGTTTYAVGKVFANHFEKGGDLLSFKPAEMREMLRKQVEEGKAFIKKHTSKKTEAA
jgi:uncharacterized protein (DUF697 family)